MIDYLLIGLVFIISFILSIAIGGGSTGSTPFSPAVGANAIQTLRAAFIVGIITFFGAVLQGQSVADTIGTGLIHNITLTPIEISIVLLIGAIFMMIGISTGYPIATAFTFTGAFIGAGIAAGGTPVYGTYVYILLFWTLGPIFSVTIAYTTIKTLLYENIDSSTTLTILTTIVLFFIFNIKFNIPNTGMISIREVISIMLNTNSTISLLITGLITVLIGYILHKPIYRNIRKSMNYFLLFLGGIVAFSAGASQVGIAVGALIPITESTKIPYISIFIMSGFGLLIGAWLFAPKMIKSVSQEYASLGPRRSIAALFSAFILAQLAVLFGYPISFNQIMISSIIGSGLAVNKTEDNISKNKIIYTIIIWIITLIISFILSFSIVSLL